MTPRRALAELAGIRLHKLRAGRDIQLIDRPTDLQRQILDAFGVDPTLTLLPGIKPESPDQELYAARRGNTSSSRPLYQGFRKTPAEVRAEVRPELVPAARTSCMHFVKPLAPGPREWRNS